MSLNGDTINAQVFFLGLFAGPQETAGVSNGLEFPSLEVIGESVFSVDVDDDSFSVTTLPDFDANQPHSLVLSDLDWFNDPTGFITAVSVPGTPGITSSFTDDSITIEFAANSLTVEQTVTFDITTECFLSGTRILTDRGDVNVEDLTIGDLVNTANGFQPIKWIGQQTVDPNQVKSALRSHPICVKAGALGNNRPQRDLYLSPDHALLVEGLLINAGALVNGTSIIKTEPTDPFTYYHVELDVHALMVVEGIYAESYLPQTEDRHCYDNSDEFDTLYPNQSRMILWPLDYPRVSSTTTVPRYICKRLNAVADEILKTKAVNNRAVGA